MEQERSEPSVVSVETDPSTREPVVERRARLFDRLSGSLGELARLESGRANPGKIYDALIGRPGDMILFGDADRLRRTCNGLIAALNELRPSGTSPIHALYENQEAMRTIERIGTLRRINILKRETGVLVPQEDEVTRERIAEVASAYAPPYGDPRPSDLRERVSDSLERWAALEAAWDQLGIGPGAETEDSDAARHRSFVNMRERVRAYVNELGNVRYRERRDRGEIGEPPYGETASEAVRRIRERMAAEAGAAFELVYYEQPEDVPALFRSGAILNLTELPAEEQSARRKSEWKDLSQVVRERAEVEAALGWPEGTPVYHLVAQTDTDMRRPGGPAENYGGVGFVIDQGRLPVDPTFTEGDSLNPAPLPGFYPQQRGGNSVQGRMVVREHLSLANALLDEGRRLQPDRLRNMLRYIEAQVGGISGTELFAAVREVVVNRPVLNAQDASASARVEALCVERGIPLRVIH